MGWTLSQSRNDGRHNEVETFSGSALPKPFVVSGGNTATTGGVKTDTDANATTVMDQSGRLRRSITNGIGQLVRVDEPTSGGLGPVTGPNQPTAYTYDVLNNLLSVAQAGSGIEQCGPNGGSCSQARTFTYSSLSRLLTATNPESGTISYSYDPNGNLSNKIDARGVKTDYIYDALNRVLNRNYSLTGSTPANYRASPDVLYTYDTQPHAKGKLIKVSSSVSTTEYTGFDILGRVTSHKQTTDGGDSAGYTTAYTYKLDGSLDEETYPSTRVVKNVLDANGDLSIVKSREDSGHLYWNYAQNFVYNAAGAVTSMELGNGLWEKTVFNSRLQPTQIGLGATVGTTGKLQLDYSYGTTQNNGNVQSQTITVPGMNYPLIQNYSYDSLNRLSSAIETTNSAQTWKQEFSYDRFGNRNFVTGSGHTDTLASCTTMCNPSFDPLKNQINSSGYSFDSAGNTTADPSGHVFTYDGENKQVLVTNGSGTVGQYWYDGDGKRVRKYAPETDETTVFVYDAAGKEIAEYSTIVANVGQANVNYLTSDHLGSARIDTDQNGAVIARHDYMPFGEEIEGAGGRTTGLNYGDDAVRKQFTGYERDGEAELDFGQSRYYSRNLGRFSSADPLNIIFEKDASNVEKEQQKILIGYLSDGQNWNKYIYVSNNPLKYIDPTGLERYDSSVSEDERKAISGGLRYIAKHGTEQQRDIANAIIKSNLTFSVASAADVGGSGNTRVFSSTDTQNAINSSRLSGQQALDYVEITIARETFTNSSGTPNSSGVIGTIVHESNHAWHMAIAISSFSYADRPGARIFNPTYWRTEFASRVTSAQWAMRSGDKQTISEALGMGIIERTKGGGYVVSATGINNLIAGAPYNLTERNQGPTFSYMQNVGMRPIK